MFPEFWTFLFILSLLKRVLFHAFAEGENEEEAFTINSKLDPSLSFFPISIKWRERECYEKSEMMTMR